MADDLDAELPSWMKPKGRETPEQMKAEATELADGGIDSELPSWMKPKKSTEAKDDEGGGLGTAFKVGAYKLASSAGAASEFLQRKTGASEEEIEASPAAGLRKFGNEGAEAAAKEFSPRAQRRAGAKWLPGEGNDIWDEGGMAFIESLALNTAMSAPSLIASVVPSALLATVGAPAVAAGAVGAGVGTLLSSGSVVDGIEEAYDKLPDKELRKQVELYDWLRDEGQLDEKAARAKVKEYYVGMKPVVSGLISAATQKFGIENFIAGIASGKAKEGLIKGGAKAFAREGAQETIESGAENLSTQKGKIDGLGGSIDWGDFIDDTLKGGITGGVMGGGVGGIASMGRKPKTAVETELPSDLPEDAVEAPQEPVQGVEPSVATGVPADPATPPVGSPAPASPILEEEVDLNDDETPVGDKSVAAALTPRVTETPSTPGVTTTPDPDVAAALAPQPTATDPSVAEVTEAVSQELVASGAPTEAVAPTAGPLPTPLDPEIVAGAQAEEAKLRERIPDAPKPRVLPSVGIDAMAVEDDAAAWNKDKGVVARDELRETGDLPIKERIRDVNAISGKSVAEMTDRRFMDAVKRIMKEQGDAAPAPIKAAFELVKEHTGATTQGDKRKITAKIKPLKAEAAAFYTAQTEERAATVNENFDERGVSDKPVEGSGYKARQKLAQRVERVSESTRLAIVNSKPTNEEMVDDVHERANAFATRLEGVVKEAVAAGAEVPAVITSETPLYNNILKRYKDMAQAIRSRKSSRNFDNMVREYQIDEMIARGGKPEEVAAKFRIEGSGGRATGSTPDVPGRGPGTHIGGKFGEDSSTDDSIDDGVDDDQDVRDGSTQATTGTNAAPGVVVPRDDASVVEDGPDAVFGAAKKPVLVEARKVRKIVTPPVAARRDAVASSVPAKPVSATVKPATPTPAQAEAGNYRKGRAFPFGMQMSVETAKGQVRKGVAGDGTPWAVKMQDGDYGYLRRTGGADGEQIDVLLGPKRTEAAAPAVFVVNQMDPDTKVFDEHKVLMGFGSEEDAMSAYERMFSDGSGQSRIQSVEIMSLADFRVWAKQPQTKPVEGELSITPEGDEPLFSAADRLDARAAIQENGYSWDVSKEDHLARLAKVAVRKTTAGTAIVGSRLRAKNSYNRVAGAIERLLRPLVNDVPVFYVSAQDMLLAPDVAEAVASGRLTGIPYGVYLPSIDAIVINNDSRMLANSGTEYQLLIHEALHAGLANGINSNPALRNEIGMLLDQAKKFAKGVDMYGFTDVHEFISEAMTNPQFQAFLATVESPFATPYGTTGTIWDKFVEFVRSFIFDNQVPNNLLEAAMRATESAFAQVDYTGRVPATRAMFSKPGLMDGSVTQKVGQSVRDNTFSLGSSLRKFGYTFSTLDNIRQMGRDAKLFIDEKGDALDKTIKLMSQIGPRAGDLRKDSEKLAEKFIALAGESKLNREQAVRMADLAVEGTILNANLIDADNVTMEELLAANGHMGKDSTRGWQGKANLAQLQKRFSALSPEFRKQWMAQAKYYKDRQNQVVKISVDNLLRDNVKLTQAQKDDLTAKTMAGTLADDDKALLNDNALFTALRDVPAFKSVSGVYFPLMRHGNNVIKTRLHKGDTMGGNYISTNVIEFRAPNDKAARAMARAYVSKTDLPASKTTRVFYDKATGKRVPVSDVASYPDLEVGYQVTVNREGVFMFESGAEAQAFLRENKDNFEAMTNVMSKAQYATDNTLKAGQLSALMSSIRASGLTDARKVELEQALHQAAARMLPGNRLQKRTIKRQNTVGASNDITRALLQYGMASSGYIARAEVLPEIRDGIHRMKSIQAAEGSVNSKAASRGLTITQVEARLAGNVETAHEPNRFVQTLLTVSFLDKLASPAYSLLNAMQPMMTTYPHLAGKFGALQASMAMTNAYRSVGMVGVTLDGIGNTAKAMRDIAKVAMDTTDIAKSVKDRVAKEKDGKKLGEMLDLLRKRGALDDGAQFELASSLERGDTGVNKGLARVDRIARQLPAAVEQLNRAVAGISAYRLSTLKGNSHEQAMEDAYDTTMLTQFDYSAANSSPHFNSGFAKVAFQFKKYAASMSVLLYDMVKRAFRGATLEERRQGRKALATLIGMQIVTAGALSLPGLELIKVFAMAAGALGLGGGYDDIERWLRTLAKDKLGEGPAEVLMRGASRVLGVDLSTRLGLDSMFLFGEPKEHNLEGMQAYLFRLISGASISYAGDLMQASNDIGNGEVWKGIEKIVPIKVIADTLKAGRTWSAGDYAPGAAGVAQAGAQAFGLRPAITANKGEERGDSIAEKAQYSDANRSKFENRYVNASPAQRKEMDKEIKTWNENAPFRRRIFKGVLDKRIQEKDMKAAGKPVPKDFWKKPKKKDDD